MATERGNAIVDGHGKPLAYLADSEIVNGSVISKDKKVLVLKLDYKKFSNGGVIVQYYSRLLWFHTEPHGSIARSLLSYDKDFLMKQRMSVHQLLSVADDGWSIVASLKVATNDQSHDVIRTINPFKPSFIEAPKGKMNPNK